MSNDPDRDLIRALKLLKNSRALVVKTALESGADPRCCSETSRKRTPVIHLAIASGDVQLVQMVLDAGASPYQCEEIYESDWFVTGDVDPSPWHRRDSALTLAAGLGQLEMVELLLLYSKPDPRALALALARAGQQGQQQIVERLTRASADEKPAEVSAASTRPSNGESDGSKLEPSDQTPTS